MKRRFRRPHGFALGMCCLFPFLGEGRGDFLFFVRLPYLEKLRIDRQNRQRSTAVSGTLGKDRGLGEANDNILKRLREMNLPLEDSFGFTGKSKEMERDKAVFEANQARLRPHLMATISLVAGMRPMAVGTGPGAATRATMAIVIIGGQSLCLLITLRVSPVALQFSTTSYPGSAPGYPEWSPGPPACVLLQPTTVLECFPARWPGPSAHPRLPDPL